MSEAVVTTPAPAVETRRDELLLAAMADQQEEFVKFRENVSERLTRLEKRQRRASFSDPENLFEYVIWAAIGFVLVRLAIYFFTQFKTGANHGHFQVSQA